MPRILVIDDEIDLRHLVRTALPQEIYELIEADDGPTGLQLADASPPDLVLCDVRLNGLNGYDVLRALREKPATANVPVVLVTGSADLLGMREGMKLGADDYLPKPFAVKDLVTMVQSQLEKSSARRKAADSALTQLRSNISMMLPQELLNPLSGIIGLADILSTDAEKLAPAERAEIGRDIHRSGERLHRLIRNFLIYTQVELLAVDPARIESVRRGAWCAAGRVLADTAERVATHHRREAQLHLVSISAEAAVSEHNLAKLLEELIDNAFRYSPPGCPVRVTARLEPGRMLVAIADEGPGIPEALVSGLRERGQFQRRFYERHATGLGLAIAVRLAELYGGNVSVAAGAGRGTVVTVEVPLVPPREQ